MLTVIDTRFLYLIQSCHWTGQKATWYNYRRLIQFASRCFRWYRRDWPSYPGGYCWQGFCAARPVRTYPPPSRINPVSFDCSLSSCSKHDVTTTCPAKYFPPNEWRHEKRASLPVFTILRSLSLHHHYFCTVLWNVYSYEFDLR